MAGLAVGTIDLDHLDTSAGEMTGELRTVRPGALHPNALDVTVRTEPANQTFIAGPGGFEGFDAGHAPERVDDSSYMQVYMRVDTTGDRARRFYDGHSHPFLSQVG
jgi:hypothetical protein